VISSSNTRELQSRLSNLRLSNELLRRQLGFKPPARWAPYRENPVGFVEEIIGENIWSKQREILNAIRDHDRVAVKSCHESGKSFISARVIGWWIATNPLNEAFAVTSAPTAAQVEAVLWRELNRVHSRGKLPGYMNLTDWKINRELVALGRKPSDDAMVAFQGLHALYMLVVFDEAGGMPGPLWNAAETLVANEGGKILAIGNPDDPNTEFGRICKPGSGWHVITISAFDAPGFTDEVVSEDVKRRLVSRQYVERAAQRWGVHSPLYQSKVLGEFPEVTDDTLIEPRFVTEAVTRELVPVGASELGVDVGRSEGGNESVVYHRHGPVARLKLAIRVKDVMVLCGHVVRIAQETGATRIKVDDPGVGGGLTDRLNELAREAGGPLTGVEIVPINTGLAATVTVANQTEDAMARFTNLKAELNWRVRDRFVAGEIDLGEDEDTQAQICSIKYFQTSRGLVRMETKDEMVKRLAKLEGDSGGESKSPDRWDALVLCFAEVAPTAGVWDLEQLVAR
jgi:hypothetical protein